MHRLYTTIIMVFLTSTLLVNASTSHSQNLELITIVKQQQKLAKNVSKLYRDFQADQKNIAKKKKMKNTINSFDRNHLKLIKSRSNTKLIQQKLTKIGEIWKIAHDLSKTKKHSDMLKTTMNDISGKMEEIGKLYQNNAK